MSRVSQIVLVVSVMLLCWLLMLAVHELGHVVGAWVTGGQVMKVVLHPLTISRTDVQPNPQPLVVVWAGPVIGVALPLVVWLAARLVTGQTKSAAENLLRFFAGFCLIANGAYIAFGSIDKIGDCAEMLRHGSPKWVLWLFGVAAIPAGLWLWNGVEKPQGTRRSALIALTVLTAVIAAQVFLQPE